MSHPLMFDDADPYLIRVRELTASFPETDEKISHGRPAFFTKKIFAYYGGSLKVDGEWQQHPQSLVIKTDPDERVALVDDPRIYVPAYLGPSGWLALDLNGDTDWIEVGELLDASYRLTAPKRQIAALDSRSADG